MTRTRSAFARFAPIAALAVAAACGTANAATDGLPGPANDAPLATAKGVDTVVFAGGCFWGIQAVFEHVKGVIAATSGYSGGTVKNPGYEQVSSGTTGHAESVRVVFDPSAVTFGTLLKVFFSVAHDPTQLNRQGPDAGTQYRSAIFFMKPEQEKIAKDYVVQLTMAKTFPRPIVTEIVSYTAFYPAETYHQDFAIKNPTNEYIMINDLPKVANLKRQFPELYSEKPAHS